MASRINPSDEINSEYIKSAPCNLHKRRNGGSLTSSIGARSKGKSGKMIFPIVGIVIFFAKILIFVGFKFKVSSFNPKNENFALYLQTILDGAGSALGIAAASFCGACGTKDRAES